MRPWKKRRAYTIESDGRLFIIESFKEAAAWALYTYRAAACISIYIFFFSFLKISLLLACAKDGAGCARVESGRCLRGCYKWQLAMKWIG